VASCVYSGKLTVDGLEVTWTGPPFVRAPSPCRPGAVKSGQIVDLLHPITLQYLEYYQKHDNRVVGSVSRLKEKAEQDGLELCKSWIDKRP
jgi:hypothetical protein